MGDAENITFEPGNNLVASASAMQWFSQPRRFFERLTDIISPGGYVSISTFGPRNLEEMKRLTGTGLYYPSREELLSFLPGNFEVVCAHDEIIDILFNKPIDVLSHVKNTGVNGISRQRWNRDDIANFCDRYEELFGLDGRVKLTYQPVYLILRNVA